MADKLGFSLGKLNYIIKALKDKGLIKINNFSKIQINLIMYTYLLQKEYLEKTKLTVSFMKRKMTEYEELKEDLKNK